MNGSEEQGTGLVRVRGTVSIVSKACILKNPRDEWTMRF